MFIVASKTFTTQETSINAHNRAYVADWPAAMEEWAIAKHFIAVTSNASKAQEFGIPESNILQIWDWVGGRYSLWSAVGLSVALAIGMRGFERLYWKAQSQWINIFAVRHLDKQFALCLLALISIWNTNFLGAGNHCSFAIQRVDAPLYRASCNN